MINPFANGSGQFTALANDRGRHSLRLLEFGIPASRGATSGPGSQAACADRVEHARSGARSASPRTATATAPH
ncbi:MbtH family NRPS accessory protein [Streptomyces zaomyceticus]|uniref:MbtH family NRPS accessory protein n=1 Tax=Streptomyces zaomyceticus TaxID=68286 RepID=UPI00386A227C